MPHELDDLTPAERRYLSQVREQLHRLDRGAWQAFGRALVAETLGATEASDPSDHHLDWVNDGRVITLDVHVRGEQWLGKDSNRQYPNHPWMLQPPRSRRWDEERNDWVLDNYGRPAEPPTWADVVVLAYHEGFSITEGWLFHPVSKAFVYARRWPSISRTRSFLKEVPPVDVDGLADAIAALVV